jgi:hypothetical protein
MGDMKEMEKTCVILIDERGHSLKEKLRDRNGIKNKKFMIINEQYNIVASKILQIEGCGEERQCAFEKWDAYVVWDLNLVQLRRNSKFYNSTNYLNHAQLIWRNQIVSGKNIWIANGKLLDKIVEAEV